MRSEKRLESAMDMMFAHDIAICSESKEQVEEKLEICIGKKVNTE